MKLRTLLLASALLPASVFATQKVLVPADDLFIPKGFDSNDNVEVVVRGHLPNLCYKSPSVTVDSIKGSEVTLKVEALYYGGNDQVCAEMIVPFTETVSLGVLDASKYNIKVKDATRQEMTDKLVVAESTSNSVDQFLYAQVDYVEKSLDSRTVALVGYNPSDCLELEKIVVDDNGTNTFSVLPVMRQVREYCPMKMVSYRYEFTVPKTLKSDIVLLHVRSLEGKSVNTTFPNYLNQ